MFNKKAIKGVIVIVLLAILLYWGRYFIDLRYYNKVMSEVTVNPVDFRVLEDGVYQGTFDARLVSATVSVKVANGDVTEIDFLKHKFKRGKPAEAILDAVINKQSLEVDTITGATNSSKTILKAIENALEQPPIGGK